MKICSKKYPYTANDNTKCKCGHMGKFHYFRNGISECNKCEDDNSNNIESE